MLSDSKKLLKRKNAQVSIFVILAILIVTVVAAYLILRGKSFEEPVPQELEPVYSYYLSCIEEETEIGALILGEQGGYIYPPEFSPGSEYMPFSNYLNFLGIGVPYWYYISSNGVKKQQVPSKEKMQEQLNDYLEEKIIECDFSQFEERGFVIKLQGPEVKSHIKDNAIDIEVNQNLDISYNDVNWRMTKHSVSKVSSLGKFYNLAIDIYRDNMNSMFLENYAVDILRLYAPVDGTELGCSPKIWMINDVREDLMEAIEANIAAIKLKGDYYIPKEKSKYFIQDIGQDADVNVNFMFTRNWPMKMEVWPSEENLLRADPVGLQEGLGMLGFCYVPYHFVYDLGFPVMVQLYSSNEMFQFPILVYVDKNVPREALDVQGLPDVVPELCEHKNSQFSVYTYNTNLESVEAKIRFKCFDTTCDIGHTKLENSEAKLNANFPQCVNGYIIANAEGYKTKKYLTSTLDETSAIIILDRLYDLELEIQKQGSEIQDEFAVVTFTKGSEVKTVSYPNMKEIELTEGQYEIKAYVYTSSEINLQGSSTEKCIDVPKTGVLGAMGMTKEKCFTMNIPDQMISFAVSGGGTQNYYITESELNTSKKLIIDTNAFNIPTKVEDVQTNYNNVNINHLGVYFE